MRHYDEKNRAIKRHRKIREMRCLLIERNSSRTNQIRVWEFCTNQIFSWAFFTRRKFIFFNLFIQKMTSLGTVAWIFSNEFGSVMRLQLAAWIAVTAPERSGFRFLRPLTLCTYFCINLFSARREAFKRKKITISTV